MKATIQEGYLNLTNENGKPLYCIHRNAVTALVPDKLGQPMAIESMTRASMCGDHCPFFTIDESNVATLRCGNIETYVGITEIINTDTQKSLLL